MPTCLLSRESHVITIDHNWKTRCVQICIFIYIYGPCGGVQYSNQHNNTKNVPSNKDRTIHNYAVMQPIKHLNIFILLLSCISTICNGL